jgi:hypothetical protein
MGSRKVATVRDDDEEGDSLVRHERCIAKGYTQRGEVWEG